MFNVSVEFSIQTGTCHCLDWFDVLRNMSVQTSLWVFFETLLQEERNGTKLFVYLFVLSHTDTVKII